MALNAIIHSQNPANLGAKVKSAGKGQVGPSLDSINPTVVKVTLSGPTHGCTQVVVATQVHRSGKSMPSAILTCSHVCLLGACCWHCTGCTDNAVPTAVQAKLPRRRKRGMQDVIEEGSHVLPPPPRCV
jgi:hypothetical protein